MKAEAQGHAGANAGITAKLTKEGLNVEALAKAEAAFKAGANFAGVVEAGILGEAQATALARAVLTMDGLNAEAKAEA